MQKMAIWNGQIIYSLRGGLMRRVTIKNGIMRLSPNVKRVVIRTRTLSRRGSLLNLGKVRDFEGRIVRTLIRFKSFKIVCYRTILKDHVYGQDLVHSTMFRGSEVLRLQVDTWRNISSNPTILEPSGLKVGGE